MSVQDFPYKTFPRGWYQIGWSADFQLNQVRPIRYFDTDLVAYRGASGKVVVMDAHCRHMGAHLGHGGKVDGDAIICPFHGWKWNCTGENLAVPYSKHTFSDVRLRTWHVAEKSGMVLIWYHPERAAPHFEPPDIREFSDPAYYPIYPQGTVKVEIPVPPQLPLENAVDFPHFGVVHKWTASAPGLRSFEDRGDSFFTEIYGAVETPKGVVNLNVRHVAWSVGLIYSNLSGLRDIAFVAGVVPIDHEMSEMRMSAAIRKKSADMPDEHDAFARAIFEAQVAEISGDHPGGDRNIWQNMRYKTNPILAPEEVDGWRALRRWSSKLYSDS